MQQYKNIALVILGFVLFNLLLFNGGISLWDEDEAAYAGFAMRMLETGDWVNPDFEWSTIHRKTPFHFWSIASLFSIFGAKEWVLRIPSVFAVFGSILLLWRMGKSIWGETVALWSAVILGTSILVTVFAKIAFTDASLLFAQTLSILALIRFMETPNWRWNLLFWLGLSLGVMIKGPPILILTGGLWFWLALFHPNRKRLIHTHPWFFLPLALIPFVLWAWLSWQRDGGALITFLYEWYVLKRVGGNVLGQTGPIGYHFVVILIAFVFWLPFLVPALGRQFKNFFNKKEAQYIYLSGWLVFGWFFYELMSSKLPSYAMGAHPALAILIAQQIKDYPPQKIAWKYIATIYYSIIILAIVGAIATIIYLLSGWMGVIYIGGLVLVVLSIAFGMLKASWEGDLPAMTWRLGVSAVGCLLLLSFGIRHGVEASPIKSLPKVIEAASQANPNKDKSIHWVGFSHKQMKISLPFYAYRSGFSKIDGLTVDEAFAAYQQREKKVIVLGDEAIDAFQKKVEEQKLSFPEGTLIDYWSTDDQLRNHPYWVIDCE